VANPSNARQWNEVLLSGIRRNVPNPPGHARNLFHTAVAMYDAWAAYDPTSVGYLKNQKAAHLAADRENLRQEAISYAAYTVIRARFNGSVGGVTTLAELDNLLTGLGYSTVVAQSATTAANTASMVGKRCGAQVLSWSSQDGYSGVNFPVTYNASINPNMDLPMAVLGTNAFGVLDQPLGAGVPAGTNPNFWQPLSFSASIGQNGTVNPAGPQSYVGLQGLSTTAFSLKRTNVTLPWIDPFGGPSKITTAAAVSPTDAFCRNSAMDVLRASCLLNSDTLVDISPGAIGNNPLGTDLGMGHPLNPVTNVAYTHNWVEQGDYARVLAEYWADGPNSETPPGHWHVLANQVSDNPLLQKRIGGTGPIVNDLEWDVKLYFALAGATHDAACAAWALKRHYSGPRPITLLRYMGSLGQSSDPAKPSYHAQGLPLEPGVVELITAASTSLGGNHEFILDLQMNQIVLGSAYKGRLAIKSWPGQHSSNPATGAATFKNGVRWMLARDWLPYQKKTFNTPAFPGYVSGHSTFSRAAAEVLTRFTGSANFPGGYHSHTTPMDTLLIDRGPSTDVTLEWTTYYDAADQAGQSRRWGGIHVSEDDYHGRVIGSMAGKSAYALAQSYWTGSVFQAPQNLVIKRLPSSARELKWEGLRAFNQKVQSSPDLINWADETPSTVVYDTNGNWVDTAPLAIKKFYRIYSSSTP
jgi:hypothetical protein